MQANTITLAVDAANDGNPANQEYTRLSEETNKSTYGHSDHSLASRKELALLRKFPTRSGNYQGTAKSTVKLTETVTVPGVDGEDVSALAVAEVSFSLPVGSSVAFQLELRQKLVALLDDDSVMADLNNVLEI